MSSVACHCYWEKKHELHSATKCVFKDCKELLLFSTWLPCQFFLNNNCKWFTSLCYCYSLIVYCCGRKVLIAQLHLCQIRWVELGSISLFAIFYKSICMNQLQTFESPSWYKNDTVFCPLWTQIANKYLTFLHDANELGKWYALNMYKSSYHSGVSTN
jgi:hypothetical protein